MVSGCFCCPLCNAWDRVFLLRGFEHILTFTETSAVEEEEIAVDKAKSPQEEAVEDLIEAFQGTQVHGMDDRRMSSSSEDSMIVRDDEGAAGDDQTGAWYTNCMMNMAMTICCIHTDRSYDDGIMMIILKPLFVIIYIWPAFPPSISGHY